MDTHLEEIESLKRQIAEKDEALKLARIRVLDTVEPFYGEPNSTITAIDHALSSKAGEGFVARGEAEKYKNACEKLRLELSPNSFICRKEYEAVQQFLESL